MLTDFGKVTTLQSFLEAAQNEAAAWPLAAIEFNIPATVIMLIETSKELGKPVSLALIAAEAEQGMLQIALLNQGLNPGSPFINAAQVAGWRYRPQLGFYKEERHAN